MQKHGTSFEKLQVLAKSMTFLAFSRNEAIFATFCTETPQIGSLLKKLQSIGPIDDFSFFSRNEVLFAE